MTSIWLWLKRLEWFLWLCYALIKEPLPQPTCISEERFINIFFFTSKLLVPDNIEYKHIHLCMYVCTYICVSIFMKSFAMRKTHTSLGHKHEISIRAWRKSANVCLCLCEHRKSSMERPKWDAHERRVLQKIFIDEKFCPIPHGNWFSTRTVYLLLQRQTFAHNNKAASIAERKTCWPLCITSDWEPSIYLYRARPGLWAFYYYTRKRGWHFLLLSTPSHTNAAPMPSPPVRISMNCSWRWNVRLAASGVYTDTVKIQSKVDSHRSGAVVSG